MTEWASEERGEVNGESLLQEAFKKLARDDVGIEIDGSYLTTQDSLNDQGTPQRMR